MAALFYWRNRMLRWVNAFLFSVLYSAGMLVFAQSAIQTSGTLVIVPAYGEVRHPNDEARVTFMVEEQDKDKSAAASRVNQKMKQGTDIVRREDPGARLKTHGYYSYPVYADDQPRPTKPRHPVAWRVGQYLEVITSNLDNLPKTAAAAQRILALNNLQFGLTEAAERKLDERRIAVAYRNLSDRIAAIAKTMGRDVSDAMIDTVDFEGSGDYAEKRNAAAPAMAMRSSGMQEAASVEEPSFEPGETTLQMRVVGKVRFK
jgi:predicted secreted protein